MLQAHFDVEDLLLRPSWHRCLKPDRTMITAEQLPRLQLNCGRPPTPFHEKRMGADLLQPAKADRFQEVGGGRSFRIERLRVACLA